MHTINANVQGCSYENFSTRKFVIQKFCNKKFTDLWYMIHVHSYITYVLYIDNA